MKAAVLEAIKKIIVKDIPAPAPQDDEVLIKVKTCGMRPRVKRLPSFL